MNNIDDFIFSNGPIFMFILAMAYLLSSTNETKTSIDYVKNSVQDAKEMYVQYEDEYEEESIVTYAELIGVLLSTLDYDIEINGLKLSKDNYDYMIYDFNKIAKTNYKKSYTYNHDGYIQKVIYQAYY